jgi:hypothetical protein
MVYDTYPFSGKNHIVVEYEGFRVAKNGIEKNTPGNTRPTKKKEESHTVHTFFPDYTKFIYLVQDLWLVFIFE